MVKDTVTTILTTMLTVTLVAGVTSVIWERDSVSDALANVMPTTVSEQAIELPTPAPEINTVYNVYGGKDTRIITEEIALDWHGSDEFRPIKIGLSDDLQEFTYYLCKGYNIDYSLVLAQMYVESSYREDAISGTNDYGLMQINECNREWMKEAIGVTDLLDGKQNIRAGLYILRKFFEKYSEPNLVLMCYNMGEDGAGKLWEQGIYESEYVRMIYDAQDKIGIKLMKAGVK